MAVSTIAHRPELTGDQVRAIFARHFDGKYRIEDLKGLFIGSRDFVVVKNAFMAVTVGLQQDATATRLIYTGFIPRIWARLVMGGVVSLLFLNGITNEIRQFIESAPEFH